MHIKQTANQHLHPDAEASLRALAALLGHPQARVVIFNEDGDDTGSLEKVDLYGPDGTWVTGVYASGRVSDAETCAWNLATTLWESILPAGQRFEISTASAG